MWRFRLLCLPFGIVIELVIFGSCWAMARIKPKTAEKMVRWAESHLPSLHWYIGER